MGLDGSDNAVEWEAASPDHIRSYEPLEYYLVYSSPRDETGTWMAYPFEASDVWHNVTGDLRIRVRKARLECDATQYAYITDVERPTGSVEALNCPLLEG